MAVGAPILGNYVLISVWDGSAETELAHQTNVTFNENRPTIDISTKDNTGSTVRKSGRYTAGLTCDSLYIDNNAAFVALKARVRDGATVKVTRKEPASSAEGDAVDLIEADCFVTGLTETFPLDGPGTVSATFEVSGNWTTTLSTGA